MSETTNTIIREHGDKLDVSIGGKFQTVPKCTCGKCIVRRLRENVFTPFPYAKDLASTYKDDYDWKTNQKEGPEYNRSKHNSFEGAYKEHIPTSLISTAKMSYKPFKVREEKKQIPEEAPYQIPFIGKSTYNRHYPDWGTSEPQGEKVSPPEDINVPLRGIPNYKESYPRYDDKYYTNGEPLNFSKPTLKFDGELDPRTTYNEAFKPTDLGNKNYFPDDQLINGAKGENTALMSGPNAPGILGTTYRRDYIKYDDAMCKLRKWLNARNMRYLVI
jgi:hypothetical protein